MEQKNNMNEVIPAEVQIIQAKQQAEFALTPVGQMLEKFKATQRIAAVYANSSLIPQSLKGDPSKEQGNTPQERAINAYNKTLANCVIALNMATRMNADALMVMQNLYIVHGQPSFSSKFLIACINASGRYSTLNYETCGEQGKDSWGCRVVAYEASDTKHKTPLYGDWVTIKMAKDEGWFAKNGSKWRTMPGLMLRYRAAAFWQRTFCPEISMGLRTAEEAEDMSQQTYTAYTDVSNQPTDLNAIALANATKGKIEDEPETDVNAEETILDPQPQGNPLDEEKEQQQPQTNQTARPSLL